MYLSVRRDIRPHASMDLIIAAFRLADRRVIAVGGVTDAEIACWLGQKTTAMARHYSAHADEKKRMENVVVKLRKRGKL